MLWRLFAGAAWRSNRNLEGKMANSSEKKERPSFFKGMKSEFKKIIWPDRKSALKQSVAVVVISVVAGVIIAVLDYVAQIGVNFLTSI